jgi:hypothetical protein
VNESTEIRQFPFFSRTLMQPCAWHPPRFPTARN